MISYNVQVAVCKDTSASGSCMNKLIPLAFRPAIGERIPVFKFGPALFTIIIEDIIHPYQDGGNVSLICRLNDSSVSVGLENYELILNSFKEIGWESGKILSYL